MILKIGSVVLSIVLLIGANSSIRGDDCVICKGSSTERKFYEELKWMYYYSSVLNVDL